MILNQRCISSKSQHKESTHHCPLFGTSEVTLLVNFICWFIFKIAGSTIALLYISSGLTVGLLIAVPTMVSVGWMMGAGLRALSRRGQEQVSVGSICMMT